MAQSDELTDVPSKCLGTHSSTTGDGGDVQVMSSSTPERPAFTHP